MIRAWSDHEIVISYPPLPKPNSSHLGNAFYMKKYKLSRSGYPPELHEMVRLPRKIALQFPPKIAPDTKNILYFFLSWHLFSLGIYSLLAPILSWHLFALGIYFLLAFIFSWNLFFLGTYSRLASILFWHLFSWHLFSKYLFFFDIYSLLRFIFSIYIFLYISILNILKYF